MRGVFRSALLCAIVAGLLAAAAAGAATTPSRYRAAVNAICRGYTPKLKAQTSAMKKAEKAKDGLALGVALGKYLVYGLAQDIQVEAQPVPTSLRPTMTPILAVLKRIDGHVRSALRRALAKDGPGMAVQLQAITTLSKPLNAELDAAGLRDCGSNQS